MTAAPATTDIISALAGVASGSAIADLRAQRPEATEHAQGSYIALFDPAEPEGLSPVERFAIALRVATIHEATEAAAHYEARLVASGGGPEIVAAARSYSQVSASVPQRLHAALRHAELLSRHPVDATSDHLQRLADAGLATVEIVVLSQIIAFVSFQVRVITALKLIGGTSGPLSDIPAGAPAAAATPGTLPPATIVRPGKLNSPPVFTRAQLEWTPWLVPLDMADATPKQTAALEGRRGNSPYFRLLALDADVLTERTATDLGIFYTHGGAPRPERELAAAATSRLNGCIYCASVHSRLSAQLSKREEDVDRLLDKGVGPGIDLGLDDRWTAVVDFAVELARTPSAATTAQVEKLRSLGLAELEILDIAQAASFFSWANRLMLTLGEPWVPES